MQSETLPGCNGQFALVRRVDRMCGPLSLDSLTAFDLLASVKRSGEIQNPHQLFQFNERTLGN